MEQINNVVNSLHRAYNNVIMKKLPITDQFLWDIFNAMSKTEDALRFLLHPPRSFKHVALMIDSPTYQKYYKSLKPKDFAWLIYYLKKHNLIKVKSLEGKKGVVITKKGFSKILRTSFGVEKKKKRDDGKWIMLIFDLPKYHERSRRLLRSILKNLGYTLLQQSVWVCPFDVLEKTEMLLQSHSLEQYIRIFLIEEL